MRLLILRASMNRVRIRITFASFITPILCIILAYVMQQNELQKGVKSIDMLTTLEYIMGMYLPILTAITSFWWSTQAKNQPEPGQHVDEDEMAINRDRFTTVVFLVVLTIPIFIYGFATDLNSANSIVHNIQTAVQTFIGAGMLYYFGQKPQ